jgi:Peptidase family M3
MRLAVCHTQIAIAYGGDLEGLPQDYIDRHKPGIDGKIHITTDYPDLFPALEYAKSEQVRRRLYDAFSTRAYPKNRDVLLDMLRTRYQIAASMRYSSWADYKASDILVTGRCEKIDLAKIKLDVKCIPTSRRSLIGNPGETFFSAEIIPHLFFNFFTSSRWNDHRMRRSNTPTSNCNGYVPSLGCLSLGCLTDSRHLNEIFFNTL